MSAARLLPELTEPTMLPLYNNSNDSSPIESMLTDEGFSIVAAT